MAKYMGKSSDEIWKLVMGNKQQSGQQEQASTQTGGKTSTSGGRYSGISADDIWKSVMEGGGQGNGQTGLGTAASDTGYQKWLRDYDTVSNKYYTWAKKNSGEGKWQADSFGGTKEAMESLLDQYDDISQGLDEKDKPQFQKVYDGLKQTYDALSESGKYYAQFRDQDDYDRERSGYTNFGVGYAAESYGLDDEQARALRQEQVQKDARERQRALAEYVAAKKAFTPVDQEYRLHSLDDRDGVPYTAEYEEDLNSRYNQARAKVTAAENALLSARNRMDAYKAGWGKIDQYAKYADAAKNEDTSYTGASFDEIRDYEYKLENEPIHSDREALATGDAQDKYLSGWLAQNPEPNMDDSLGLWLSMTEAQRQQAAQSTFPALQTLANTANDGLWDQLNDTEIQTYYYLRHNQGQEAALQYLKDLNPELNRRTDESFIETVQNASTAGRWGYEAAAYGLNLIGNVEAGVGELGEMITGNHNPYSNTSRAQRYAGYIRGINGQSASKFVQDVANNAGASEEFSAAAAKYAENTYQAITSGIDSAIGATVFGPAYLSIMGLGAMAQKSSEQELRGATDRQIAVGAIGAGCIEMLFEKVSLDHFFDNFIKTPPKSWKELIAKTLVQAGIEGNEEINTEIANIAFDAINMGKNCDVSMSIREYMAQGLSEEEAKKRATVDAVTDIYWAGFGGFVSGGVMAGASGTAKMGLSKAANAMDNYDIGKPLLSNGRVADLQAQAEALTDAKKSAKLSKAAQEVAHNASVGDNSLLNTYKTGKVASQIAQQAGREARGAETAEFRKAAEKYLEGQRGIQNKKHALNVLTRAYDGTAMLPGDKAYMRMIGGEKLTQEILNSVGGKETLQENAKPSVEASMRTIGNVQSSVLGIAPETKAEFDSDNSGQAFRKSDSEPINILASEPIAKVENGVLYLNTDDGQEIAASDVSYGNSGEAAVYAAISNMQTDTETARSLLNGIDDSGLSSAAYARAIRNAYYRGMNGVKFEDTPGYSDAAKLPEAQRRAAWEAGKQRRAAKVQEQEALIDSGKAGTRESGVTMQESAKSIRNLNKQQQTGMAAAKALAAAGLHVEVYASTEAERKAGKPNGIYRKTDGSIAIDLNAGDNGQGAVAYALAHETTHFIQDYSPAKFETYAELIIAAAESKGISYDSLLARQLARLSEMEEYKNLSETELQDIAYDETIAEMSETILTDTDAANRLSQQIYKQDRTLWQKIKDFFTGLVEKLRSAYRDSDPDSDIGRMLKRAVQDNAEIAQAWAEAVREAGENYQLQDGQKNNARGGERYSARQYQADAATFAQEIDQWNRDGMESGARFELGSTGEVLQGLGAIESDIYMNGDKIQKILQEHPEITLNEIKQIPQILNDPTLILKSRNVGRGGRQNTRMVLFGSVKGQNGMPVLTVFDLRPSENHFVLNDMQKVTSAYTKTNGVTFLENSFVLYADKKRTTSLLRTIGFQMPIELLQSGFIGNITYNKQNVNLYGEKFSDVVGYTGERYSSRNARDAEYMELAKDPEGNREALSEMVKQAARDAGYTQLFYHGSKKGGGFTVFRDWQYFTENRDYAKRYTDRNNEKSLYTTYVKMENPFDTRIDSVRDIFEDARMEYGMGELQENGLPDWTDGYDIADYIDENDLPYDSIVLDEGGDLVNGKPVSRGLSYVVRKSNQVKSADAVTYDDNGNVVPLSQRFDTGNEDIRYSSRNQTESKEFKRWFGDWQNDPANASKVVNADGTPKVLYHQTSADFTIFEPRHEGAGTRDQDTPFGIFMKSSDRNIGVKGEKQMALYARIVNPLRVTDRADLMYQLKKISPEYEKVSAELRSLNDAYQQKHEDAKKAFADYIVKWRQENPDASRTAIYDDAGFNEVYEAEDNVLDEWEAEARKVELRSKEAITRDLEKQGYDGVIIRTDEGSFGRSTDAYIALHPEQVKSATDNVGTFDKSNPDIRFSDRNSQSRQVERLEKKNAELKAEAEYLKQVVKVQKSGNKAHILDRSSVNAIGEGLMESVNAKGSEFGKLLNDFYRALGTEDMSYETMQDRAGELAEWLLEHHQAERDGYAQDILDFLKKRRVSLSDGQIGDIEYSYGSLNDFKRAIKGSIILDQNAETSLDQLWQEAAAQFPDRFGADVTESNMPDGLAQIVGWANSAESSSEAEFQYYRAEQKADLTQKILMGYLESKPMESVSDSMKKELDDLKAKHKAEMADLRQKGSQALEAEQQRNAAAIATMKAAQRAVDIAQKGLWETERQEIKYSYEQQMKELKGQYSEDTGTMQKEFFRLLREYEKQQAKGDRQSAKDSDTISALREALSKEAQSHKEDSAAWNKEFSRLLREYETSGRKVDRLEAKVKQQREAAAQKVENRKKTEERHKLQNTIDTLNKYLLQPTNTAHVPQGLQSSVAMALRAINGVLGDSKAAQNADRLAEYAYRLRELEKNPSANEDKIADLNRKIQNLTGKDSSMKAALTELQAQYHKLETQGNNLYDSNIEALIQNTMEQIGDTEYRNLSLQQLKAVRDSYTALLTTIRNANKAFVAGKNARIDEMVQRATTELSLMKKKNPNQTAIGRNIDQFFWNNEKPVYAFERIGSAVMSELYDNLRKGEDTFYRDVSEARKFFLESAEKNGFSKWDLNELKEFTAANGQKFQLSLDELMSLYAYSLRPQAREHLTKGGIVLGENTRRFTKGPLGVTRETTYNDANAYTLTDETIDAIAGSLTKEQRQFAFEMQQYLAKIMGAKGDEVNMALYGIKKFGEETYWPLKSSDVFSERVRAQQENTGNKLKNKGFTKALTPKANNAIELSTLTETWAEHVSDMSMYHSFTLPMEDFYRVYNWTQKGDSKGKQTMGVRQMIQQTAGKGAVTYIDQFLKDLNGGLRADPRETVSKAMLSGFKKAAVSASLSVAIQQPSAVGRALAYIEPKYFIGSKVEGTKVTETWEQLKKYAAVAGLKEMGRFDVDMGRSTLEYIIGRNGLSTWGKITDKVDEFSGWLPEMADQVTWCAIWEAAKRKTQAQNPGLHGEAMLQKAGELFTDTITRTQVYDSVFSRSANMRAKSGLMSMATAFMAEPTTTANMVEDAIRKFQKGDKRMSAKMLSSVAVATVLNAALAAVAYAARDDDKDKTYWEKYLASLAGETADSFNPLTYVPIVADINNLLMGYSIERTDMSLASDLVTTLKKITTLYQQYDDDWDEDKKKEWNQKVKKAWFDNVLMAGTVTGLPLKNIYRDTKAAVNVITNPSNGAEMSADTILNAMLDSAKKSLPVVSWIADESSSDQLYKAITQGKDVLARRLKAQFGDEKKYESALLKGLRENDPRIKTAAQYAIDGNTPKRVAIIREIVAEGHYTQDQVIKAINQKANSMKEKSESGKESPPEKLYDYSEYVNAAANGLGYAGDVQKELIRYQADRNQEADGKLTRQEAESDALKTFQSNVKSDAKDGYAAGELTEAQVRKVLTAADIAEGEELDDLMLQWDTEMELGDEISWSNARYLDYAETIHPAGISADTYDSYIRAVSRLSSIDEDGDGKTDITRQEQVIEYIDSMPISDAQKDTLFRAEYPKARKSVLRKLPWR